MKTFLKFTCINVKTSVEPFSISFIQRHALYEISVLYESITSIEDSSVLFQML